MLLWIYKKNTQFQNSLSGTILKDCSTKPFVHFMPGHGGLRDTKGSEHPSGQRRKRRNHQVGKCHFVKDTLSLRLGLAMSGHLQEQKWNNLQNHDIIQVGSWQDGTHISVFQVPLTGNRMIARRHQQPSFFLCLNWFRLQRTLNVPRKMLETVRHCIERDSMLGHESSHYRWEYRGTSFSKYHPWTSVWPKRCILLRTCYRRGLRARVKTSSP